MGGALMNCVKCGAEISETAKFCENCGLPTTVKKPSTNKALIWVIAIVSALFVFIIILGIVAALVIPNLVTASNKAKNMLTMTYIANISKALSNYKMDYGTVPAQDGTYDINSDFYEALSPSYFVDMPVSDGWGNNILVYCGEACDGKYGITGSSVDDFLVISLGKDGVMEDWEFDENSPVAGVFVFKHIEDFNKDIVVRNGKWIRAIKDGIFMYGR